ncbi:MAG: bacterio-opsin activator, partial [Salinirussus sp.]
MKYLRVTASPDPELVPELYTTVTQSGPITELRVVDWNLATTDSGTLLYAIDGDAVAFRTAATDTDGVDRVEIAAMNAPVSYALIDARPNALPFFETMVTAIARTGMILRKPLVYRQHQSHGHVVGHPEPLQSMFDDIADSLEIQV